jgi:uncharacterized protein (TIGR02186 family)
MTWRLMLALVLSSALWLPAWAEELAAGISRDKIEINSRFTGTEVAIFGSVEPAAGEVVQENRARDIIVVVRSDRASQATVRRKEAVGPIWVNRDFQTLPDVPAFYFVASNRTLAGIAAPDVLAQFQLGFSNLDTGSQSGVRTRVAFRQAFLDAQAAAQLYAQHEGAVTFMSPSLFRTTVALPPNVPAGNLRVTVYAFKDGEVTSSNSMTLFIDKTGIERVLSDLSRREPLLYASAVLVVAIGAGLAAAAAFRHRH